MSLVKAQNVIYEYFRRDEDGNIESVQTALDQIDLKINQGDFIAVLGHNGSGKSTLAKHLNALLTPTEGNLWIDGKNTKDIEKIWEIRQRAGMVFQNPDNQMVANVVDEEVAFGPENLGILPEKIVQRMKNSLQMVKMEKYEKAQPSKLSGGQKQRIAIAGVLAMHPKCIVLDEPTAMLDPDGRKEVMNAVVKLNKEEKITIIFITHYMEEALLADKIIVMNRGKICMKGRPEEIFMEVEKLEKLHLDVPLVVRMAEYLRKNGMPLRKDIFSLDELVQEIQLLLC